MSFSGCRYAITKPQSQDKKEMVSVGQGHTAAWGQSWNSKSASDLGPDPPL
jgi:hypothetical protein